MPTKKPRVMIVMEEDSYNTFMRFKSLTGKSLSSVLSDVVNEVAPTFAKLCETLEAASKMPDQAKEKVLARMTALEGSLNQTLQDIQQQDLLGQAAPRKPAKAKHAKIAKPSKR